MNYDTDELQGCTEAERSKANARMAAVQIWNWSIALGRETGKNNEQIIPDVLRLLEASGFKVSLASLYIWRRAVRDKGIVGLVDLRGRDDRPRYRRFFLELARRYEAELITAAIAHELTKEQAVNHGWAIPTIRESELYIKIHVRPGVTTERGRGFAGRSDDALNDI